MKLLRAALVTMVLCGCHAVAPTTIPKTGTHDDFHAPADLGDVTLTYFVPCEPVLRGEVLTIDRVGRHRIQWQIGCTRCPDGTFVTFDRNATLEAMCRGAKPDPAFATCPIVGDMLLFEINAQMEAQGLVSSGYGLGCLSLSRPQITLHSYRDLAKIVAIAASTLRRWDASGPLDLFIADQSIPVAE